MIKEFFEVTNLAIETAAVLLLLAGLLFSTVRFLIGLFHRPERLTAFERYRQELGRTLLLSLEVLIAADIIHSLVVDQSFKSLGELGLLVLIRTFLSFSLELEITGRWPWQKAPSDE